jgi:transcriptional regulator with XRE-family HTH domain
MSLPKRDSDEIPSATRAYELRMRIAANVRTQRERLGYSQERLADECLMSRTVISRIERGEHEPRVSTLIALAEALDVAPSTLIDPSTKG